MNVVRSLALVAALGLVAWAQSARATVVIIPTMEEMVHRSEVIVHAVVRDTVVEEDRPGRLVTLTSLEVLDGIDGAKVGDVLTVFQVGGERDGRVAWIAGAHHFRIGEELVLFAVRPPALAGRIVLYGIGFGLFSVVDGVDGKHVEEIGGDVVQVKRTAQGETFSPPPPPRRYESLDAFKTMLRGIRTGTLPTLPAQALKRRVGPSPNARRAPLALPPQAPSTAPASSTAKE